VAVAELPDPPLAPVEVVEVKPVMEVVPFPLGPNPPVPNKMELVFWTGQIVVEIAVVIVVVIALDVYGQSGTVGAHDEMVTTVVA